MKLPVVLLLALTSVPLLVSSTVAQDPQILLDRAVADSKQAASPSRLRSSTVLRTPLESSALFVAAGSLSTTPAATATVAASSNRIGP